VTDPAEIGATPLGAALRRYHQCVQDIAVPAFLRGPAAFDGLGAVIVVTDSRGKAPPMLSAALGEIHRAAGDRTVLVATGTPYDLLACPEVGTFVATYGRDPAAIDAAAKVLTGRAPATGRLPVSLPGLYAAGHRHSPT